MALLYFILVSLLVRLEKLQARTDIYNWLSSWLLLISIPDRNACKSGAFVSGKEWYLKFVSFCVSCRVIAA